MQHALLELSARGPVLFDGAMGTMLMAAGLSPSEAPEAWNVSRPEKIAEIHRQYYAAGSQVAHTNTFGCNPVKLQDRGLAQQMRELNLAAARAAAGVKPEGCFLAGDIGPTGKMLAPLGELSEARMEEAFFQQAQALLQGGVDLVSIETMFSLQEALIALGAALRAGAPLVAVSITYSLTKRGFFTMMGETPQQCVQALEQAGAGIIGANCTLGSKEMLELTKELRPLTSLPLLVQPNAGSPEIKKGVTFYRQDPGEFAQDALAIRRAGADMLGGCCGTTPEFIRTTAEALFSS